MANASFTFSWHRCARMSCPADLRDPDMLFVAQTGSGVLAWQAIRSSCHKRMSIGAFSLGKWLNMGDGLLEDRERYATGNLLQQPHLVDDGLGQAASEVAILLH